MSAVDPYAAYLLATYHFWAVYLHPNQYYLGRVYFWLLREVDCDLLDLTDDEFIEFMQIARQTRAVLERLFRPDRYNWAYLANIANHPHIHLIPRYASAREFAGQMFVDQQWGKNYSPYPKDIYLSKAVIAELLHAFRAQML